MSGPFEVVWSDEALDNVDSIVAYLEKNWNQHEIDTFLETLEEQEAILSYYPKAYPSSEKRNSYRRCVVTKQITIFYKFEDEIVSILYVFDTRQDPKQLNLHD